MLLFSMRNMLWAQVPHLLLGIEGQGSPLGANLDDGKVAKSFGLRQLWAGRFRCRLHSLGLIVRGRKELSGDEPVDVLIRHPRTTLDALPVTQPPVAVLL